MDSRRLIRERRRVNRAVPIRWQKRHVDSDWVKAWRVTLSYGSDVNVLILCTNSRLLFFMKEIKCHVV